MGHDICMVNSKGIILSVDYFKGGSYCARGGLGGTSAEICITYNYSWFFFKFMDKKDGIRKLYGLSGREVKPIILRMIKELCSRGMGNGEHNLDFDYWMPTPDNVKKVLDILLSWCNKHPQGIFRGD